MAPLKVLPKYKQKLGKRQEKQEDEGLSVVIVRARVIFGLLFHGNIFLLFWETESSEKVSGYIEKQHHYAAQKGVRREGRIAGWYFPTLPS